jgi:hypothetical protein
MGGRTNPSLHGLDAKDRRDRISLGVVVHACNSSYSGGIGRSIRILFRPALGKKLETLYEK